MPIRNFCYIQRLRAKLTHFTVSKIGITKFLWGDLWASPPQLFDLGGDRPMHGVGAYETTAIIFVKQLIFKIAKVTETSNKI